MRLDPFVLDEKVAAREILRSTGLINRAANSNERKISKLLDERECGLEELADSISSLARGAQDDTIKLRATELGLKCHGVLDKVDTQTAPQIVFIGADQSIVNVLIPR